MGRKWNTVALLGFVVFVFVLILALVYIDNQRNLWFVGTAACLFFVGPVLLATQVCYLWDNGTRKDRLMAVFLLCVGAVIVVVLLWILGITELFAVGAGEVDAHSVDWPTTLYALFSVDSADLKCCRQCEWSIYVFLRIMRRISFRMCR